MGDVRLDPRGVPTGGATSDTQKETPAVRAKREFSEMGQKVWDQIYTKSHPRPLAPQAKEAAKEKSPDKIDEAEKLFSDLAKIQARREPIKRVGYGISNFLKEWSVPGVLVASVPALLTLLTLQCPLWSKKTIEKSLQDSELSRMLRASGKTDPQIKRQLISYGQDRCSALQEKCNGLRNKENAEKIGKLQEKISNLIERSKANFDTGDIAKGAMYLKRAEKMFNEAKALAGTKVVTFKEDQASQIRAERSTAGREKLELEDELLDLQDTGNFDPGAFQALKSLLRFADKDLRAIDQTQLRTKEGVDSKKCEEATHRLDVAKDKLELIRRAIDKIKMEAKKGNFAAAETIVGAVKDNYHYKKGILKEQFEHMQKQINDFSEILGQEGIRISKERIPKIESQLTDLQDRLKELEKAIQKDELEEAETIKDEIYQQLASIEEELDQAFSSGGGIGGLGSGCGAFAAGCLCAVAFGH